MTTKTHGPARARGRRVWFASESNHPQLFARPKAIKNEGKKRATADARRSPRIHPREHFTPPKKLPAPTIFLA